MTGAMSSCLEMLRGHWHDRRARGQRDVDRGWCRSVERADEAERGRHHGQRDQRDGSDADHEEGEWKRGDTSQQNDSADAG
jgi:hypothetical protein